MRSACHWAAVAGGGGCGGLWCRGRSLWRRFTAAWRLYWEDTTLCAAAEFLLRLDAPALREMGFSHAEIDDAIRRFRAARGATLVALRRDWRGGLS